MSSIIYSLKLAQKITRVRDNNSYEQNIAKNGQVSLVMIDRTMDYRLAVSLLLSIVLTFIIRANTKEVQVVEGPIVSHANTQGQWGGTHRILVSNCLPYSRTTDGASWAVSHARFSIGIQGFNPPIHDNNRKNNNQHTLWVIQTLAPVAYLS